MQKRRMILVFLGTCVLSLAGLLTELSIAQVTSNDKGIIRGTVRDHQGPLYGISVRAKAEGKKYTTSVFTDDLGEYVFPPLPMATYIVSVGMKWERRVTVDSSSATQDFDVELGPGFLNQTSGASWLKTLPDSGEGKKLLIANCSGCHSIWRAIDHPRDTLQAWMDLIQRMEGKSNSYRFTLSGNNRSVLANYLASTISTKIKQDRIKVMGAMIRPRGEGAKAVFTDWDLPQQFGEITGVKADSKGMYWFTTSSAGGLGRLDPRTGDFQTWPAPLRSPSQLHDLIFDREENVWTTAIDSGQVIKFNTKSLQYTSWDVPAEYGTRPHLGDLDSDGNYWFTMFAGKGRIVKLDPRSGKFTGYPIRTADPTPYGLIVDRSGRETVWFAELTGSKLGKIDSKTGEVTEYATPTPKAGSRRLKMDSKGIIWFTETFIDKIGRFDPKTIKFSEYDSGSLGSYPYSIQIDKTDHIWFSSHNDNTIGKFDPKTKKVTYTLFPTPDTGTRDPGFDYKDGLVSFVYGSMARAGIGRVYFRP